MRFSVPVDPEKCQARQAGDWGRLRGEAPQEVVNPPSLTYLGGEVFPIGTSHSKPSRQNLNKIIVESAGPKDLGHQPRRLRGVGVARGGRRR